MSTPAETPLRNPMPEGGQTTHEKVLATAYALLASPPDQLPPDVRDLIGALQIMAGTAGIDPVSLLVAADPADADVMVDKAIALLLSLRGDDLAPFNFHQAVA